MASGKTLQSTIEIAGVLSPTLQNAINNAVDKLAGMAEETLESADAASRLAAEMTAQEDVLKAMEKAYAGYVVNGQESSEQARTLAARIQTVSDELEENRGTLEAAEKAAKGLTAEQEEAADAYKQLEKKISSQEDELASLRRAYANVALEQGESSDEAQRLKGKISTLSGELNSNKTKLNSAKSAADAFGQALEGASKDAEDSSGGYTVLKDAIGDLVADAIEAGVEAFKNLATEGDSALAMLEARTGATSSAMDGFGDVMHDVYNAGYGESLTNVSDTMSVVIQQMDDLDNASLAQVTKSALSLEEVFGYDTTESLRAANSLMDQFGLTSEEAFNLIVQGAQNGLDQNGDMLDTINEYSVQFKDAGYSAEEMFNMLKNGTETGTWSVDKLGDAVKEFNIRMSDGTASEWLEKLGVDADAVMAQFNKGGPEAQKAIGAVMQAINDCDDATLQYQAGVGIFGTMWEDLGADTVNALMNAEGAFDSAESSMQNMSDAAHDSLEGSLSQLGRTLEAEVVQPLTKKLTPVLKNVVQFVTSKVEPVVNWFVDNLPTLGVALAGIAATVVAFKWSKIINGIKGAAAALKALATGNPVGMVILGITALVTTITYLWNNCEEFRNFWIGLWEGIKSAVSVAVEWIGQCWESIKAFFTGDNPIATYFQTAWTNIQLVWDTVVSYFSTLWESIKLIFSVVGSVLSGDFSAAWESIKLVFAAWGEFFSGLWTNVQTIFLNVGTWFSTTFGGAWEAIKTAFSFENVGAFFGQIWNGIVTIFSTVATWFGSMFSTAWESIKTAMSFENVGTFFSQIWNGIVTIFSTVATWFGSTFTSAWTAIKAVFDPVKEFFSGVWNTIVSLFTSIGTAVGDAISGGVRGAINKVLSGAISIINGFISAINFAIDVINGIPGVAISRLALLSVPQLAAGGFTDGVSIAGEAGTEAVISFDPAYHQRNVGIWERAGRMLGVLDEEEKDAGAGLTSKAAELLTLDDFSLGSLADSTSVVYYYDFSHFTWSPTIETDGDADEGDLMALLKAHEAEFFDWLEEFIRMREVAEYA